MPLSNPLQQYQDTIAFLKEKMEEADFWEWLGEQDEEDRDYLMGVMGDPAFTLHPHQVMPDCGAQAWHWKDASRTEKVYQFDGMGKPVQWRVWFLRMGRGAGKTRGAAVNVNLLARYLYPGLQGLIVGPTIKHVRESMVKELVEGAQPDFVPRYEANNSRVVWPNGSSATIYTTDDQQAVRGPSVYWGWGDELTLWREGSYDNMRMTVRNNHPHGNRLILGTSPLAAQTWVKAIEKKSTTITHVASSLDNPDGLDPGMIAELEQEVATGSRKAREEVLGEWIEGESKLWTLQDLDAITLKSQQTGLKDFAAELDIRVLGVDPGGKRDLSGISLTGSKGQMKWVLGDWSTDGGSTARNRAIIEIVRDYMRDGDVIVIETNAHNDAAEDLKRLLSTTTGLPHVYVRSQHAGASNNKTARAERVSEQFYDAGRVRHFRPFPELHTEMDKFYELVAQTKKSPDRVDALTTALVWYLDTKPADFSVWTMPLKVRFGH